MTKTATIARAAYAVAEAFGVPAIDILGKSTVRSVTPARYALFTLLADDPKRNVSDVARLLDRNNGTVLHGFHRALALAKTDKDYAAKLAKARELHARGNVA